MFVNVREDTLFELHIAYVNLCATGLITEDEHMILEDALDRLGVVPR